MLWLWTCSPGAIGVVAILWPIGTWVLAWIFSPAISVPGSRSARATTTLSAGLRRIVSGGMAVPLPESEPAIYRRAGGVAIWRRARRIDGGTTGRQACAGDRSRAGDR